MVAVLGASAARVGRAAGRSCGPAAGPGVWSGARRALSRHLVENKESTARDHLANERTFLAWSRTGMSFLAAGLGYFYASTEHGQHVHKLRESNILPATGLLVGNGLSFLGFAVSCANTR
jgi:uncharacterized membrane protein YidH (DUF202 family)